LRLSISGVIPRCVNPVNLLQPWPLSEYNNFPIERLKLSRHQPKCAIQRSNRPNISLLPVRRLGCVWRSGHLECRPPIIEAQLKGLKFDGAEEILLGIGVAVTYVGYGSDLLSLCAIR
jgi:hypothetical protein